MAGVIFWLKLKKPIMALAPMAEINDAAFRTICKEFGADVVYSEMISASALYYDNKKTLDMLKMTKKEHPVVFQLFGKELEHFKKAAKIVEKAGADGIDINFGCPARKIVKNQEGVILMRDLALSKKIIQTVLESVEIPVSIKIRAGINANNANKHECERQLARRENNVSGEIIPAHELSFRAKRSEVEESLDAKNRYVPVQKIPPLPLDSPARTAGSLRVGRDDRMAVLDSLRTIEITALDFVKNIMDLPISAIMIHGRTYSQGFADKPDYEMIKSVVNLLGDKIIVLANGGISTPEDACEMLKKTGAHGIGLARGVLGRPWLFNQVKNYAASLKNFSSAEQHKNYKELEFNEIKKVILKHAKLTHKMKGDHGIIEMRKYLLWYVKGWENAREVREGFKKVSTVAEIERVLGVN